MILFNLRMKKKAQQHLQNRFHLGLIAALGQRGVGVINAHSLRDMSSLQPVAQCFINASKGNNPPEIFPAPAADRPTAAFIHQFKAALSQAAASGLGELVNGDQYFPRPGMSRWMVATMYRKPAHRTAMLELAGKFKTSTPQP